VKPRRIYTLLLLILATQYSLAQSNFSIDNAQSTLTITGTSNVHDWEMNASGMIASIVIEKDMQEALIIADAKFTIPSKNIKSHSSIMDKKTREAIDSEKHKYIEFKLGKVDKLNITGNRIEGIAVGDLSLAGKSQTIFVPFSGFLTNDDQIIIEGTKEINLSDYNISAPTAMMGTLKTGEKVNVLFNLYFVSNASTKTLSIK
jgi:polyisoprenoid-binding protein YceI